MRRRLSPQPTETCLMASPVARAASSARVSSSSLRSLPTDSAPCGRPARGRAGGRVQRCVHRPLPERATAAAARPPRSVRPRSGRPYGRNPSSRRRRRGFRLPASDPRRAPRPGDRQARSPAVSASSAKTSAMSPPPTKAVDRTRFEHVRVDEGGVGHGGIVIAVPADPSQPPTAAGHGPHAGLSRATRADRRRRGHRRAFSVG